VSERKRYNVSGQITISMHTEVMASSPEEARKIAEERSIMSLCHQCASGEPAEEWVTSGELDGGEVQELDVQEDS
jgi:hypothetical protein